ncbi:hypothetical protein DBV15_11137 [Temnothorax longispinosus]|uniref:Uncharacterized protein n=1 Tax=Temnothorax longispinosus TaxID=300112 RepID=A0A4S2KM25_9HYME|nr:hypothetical protein DBV15_11137 [Temnothorax longispinosus]
MFSSSSSSNPPQFLTTNHKADSIPKVNATESRSVIDAVQFRVRQPALTEKHLSGSQCRATSTVQLSIASILQSLILSRSPQHHVADSLRRLHNVEPHYRMPRSVWILLDARDELLEFPSDQHPSSSSHERASRSCARCISSDVKRAKVPRSRPRITSRGVLRRRCRLPSYAAVHGFPRLRFPRRRRLLLHRGLHAGFTRDRRIPEKEIRGRDVPSPLRLLTQRSVERGNKYGFGVFVVLPMWRLRSEPSFGFTASSVSEHYRSKLAKRAAPAEQKQSVAAASCETITLRRKLPFEAFCGLVYRRAAECRYRAERKREKEKAHRNLEGWYTSRYTDCFVTPAGDSPVADFTNAREADDRSSFSIFLRRSDIAPVTANRRVNRILSSAIRARRTGSDVAYRETVIAAPCVALQRGSSTLSRTTTITHDSRAAVCEDAILRAGKAAEKTNARRKNEGMLREMNTDVNIER